MRMEQRCCFTARKLDNAIVDSLREGKRRYWNGMSTSV